MSEQADQDAQPAPRKPTWRERASALPDFVSDGCTMAPDLDFRACCEQHDYYHQTGEVSRAEADRRLRLCLRCRGYRLLSWVYYAGVRLGGWFWWRRRHGSMGRAVGNGP